MMTTKTTIQRSSSLTMRGDENNISISRRRMRSAPTTHNISPSRPQGPPPEAYRLHFSCDFLGKYVAASKRKITWQFGFTNLAAIREGKEGRECRGEEHEIVLIWSVNSGKIRVFWNSLPITHYFKEEKRHDRVLLKWEERSGVEISVAAHASPLEIGNQYDLFVGKESFHSLPHLSELRDYYVEDEDDIVSEGSVPDLCEEADEPPAEGSLYFELPPELKEDGKDASLDTGLGLGGFSPSSKNNRVDVAAAASNNKFVFSFGGDELEDELTSDFRTNNLESLRHLVTSTIPGTEDMVSRAIVDAFSDDCSSSSLTSSSSFESMVLAPIDFEAEALRETNEWMYTNVECVSRSGVSDQQRSFFQRQINTIFMHSRHGHLPLKSAVSILVNVATLLGLPDIPLPDDDTLILDVLDKNLDVETLIADMCEYGEVKEAAICKGRRFGICRFISHQGLSRALAGAERGTLRVGGIQPFASKLGQRKPRRPDMIARRTKSEPAVCGLPKPPLHRRRSHQRNSIIIDANNIGQSSFFDLINEEPAPNLITPDSSVSTTRTGPSPFFDMKNDSPGLTRSLTPDSRSTLKPNDFKIIPARASPLAVYDNVLLGHEITLRSPSMTVLE